MIKSKKKQTEQSNEQHALANLRREYGKVALKESILLANPFDQFEHWMNDIVTTDCLDPTAMVLSTVDEQGCPDSRVVLLKGFDADGFVFYTHYDSMKGLQLAKTPYAALNFYWPELSRQVRIRGAVKLLTRQASEAYFASRPRGSQASAIVSNQSQPIDNDNTLVEAMKTLLETYGDAPLPCPTTWGGYRVIPEAIEFWQGRDDRLHDRFLYLLEENRWLVARLAP